MNGKKVERKDLLFLLAGLLLIVCLKAVVSLPGPPGITYHGNETTAAAGTGTAATHPGGYIHIISLSTDQQNYKWKGYVGNISGKFVLEDSSQNSIYEWSSASIASSGMVFASRNDSIQWLTTNCSATNRTYITDEDTVMGMTSTASDSINQTFGSNTHKAFQVASRDFPASTCPAISSFVNDFGQGGTEADLFQEVLMYDGQDHFIYATMIEEDEVGFDGNQYDFQFIIAEKELSITTYYFYTELQ